MFKPKKKKFDVTPVESVRVSPLTGADGLRAPDGGYVGPMDLNSPSDLNKDGHGGNVQNPGADMNKGKMFVVPAGDNRSVSSGAGSQVKRKRCCNPDYGICGGCCYPCSCFGFSQNQSLCVMACGLIVILIALIIGVVVLLTAILKGGSASTCMTQECVVAAGDIISKLDSSIDPCDNFYQFTCGNWIREHPIPAESSDYSGFSQLNDATIFKLKEHLEADSGPGDSRIVNITRNFYTACTNEAAWQEAGVTPILEQLDAMGGFPLINSSWSNASYNWVDGAIRGKTHYANHFLLGPYVMLDAKNSSQYAINFLEGILPGPRDIILSNNTEYRDSELTKIAGMVKILKISVEKRNAMKTSAIHQDQESSLRPLNETENISNDNINKKSRTTGVSQADEDKKLKEAFEVLSYKKKLGMNKRDSVIPIVGINPDTGIKENDITGKKTNKFGVDIDVGQSDNLRSASLVNEDLTEGAENNETSSSPYPVEVVELYDFMYELAMIMLSTEEQSDQYFMYNAMTVAELQKRTDALGDEAYKMDWMAYFKGIFQDSRVEITADERIIVAHPSYIDGLLKLIKRTPSTTVANFMGYLTVLSIGAEASGDPKDFFWATVGDNSKKIGRTEKRVWLDCTQKANQMLGPVVGYFFIKNNFPNGTLPDVREIVSDVHGAFHDIIVDTDWMDKSTKDQGIKKVNHMKELVGYDPMIVNITMLNEHYKYLPELSPKTHFNNMLTLARYSNNATMDILKDKPIKGKFVMDPVNINAAYVPNTNEMNIPAAILQSPFYRANTISALNYGGIGVVVGHEVSHGFDTNGKEGDWAGNLRPWWTNESYAVYQKKSQCFVDQYDEYPRPGDLKGEMAEELKGYMVNGKLTQGENIADNGGIQAAFRAFQKHLKEAKEREQLPGLEMYTEEQLFFISFAQLWCTNYTPMGLKIGILTDVHAPGPFRVKGVYHNTRQMKEAFGCSLTPPAYFPKTCKLW